MTAEFMFDRLQAVERRFTELEAFMADPSIVTDRQAYQKYSREYAELSPIVDAYRQYRKIDEEIEKSRELLEDRDPEIKELAREDLHRLKDERERLDSDLQRLLTPKDPNDDRNVLIEIRAGTGGEEAALFVSDLYRMYTRYAEIKRWKVEVMDSSPTGIGGLKEITLMISGANVYSNLKYEGGVHRVQRVPKTEASGRIHTSAVTVAVLPEAADVEVTINEGDIETDVFRASGPGGQGVNTTDSAVRITHKPSGLVVVCREERSQIKNKAKAMKLLKSRLLEQKQREQDEAISKTRKSFVGSGDRSEKIRTYNFPQSRVTDHRVGLTIHQLDQVLDGKLDEFITTLRTHYQSEAMKSSA